MASGLIILIVGSAIPGCLLLGSIVVLRSVKNWATITLLAGSILMVASSGACWVALFFRYGDPGIYVMLVAGTLTVGVLAFCAGFLGLCAKYGVTARRAQELEGVLEQVQQRMSSGG